MNTCLFQEYKLFRNGSVLVRISLVPYKYVPIYMFIVRDAYYARVRIYAQRLKIHVIVIVKVWLKVCNV